MPDARDTRATISVVAPDGSEVVTGYLPAQAPELALVDALARYQLDACRRGRRVRLRNVGDDLRGLLELAGLEQVLGLEAGRQPELGEERGVQEVVQADDPVA